jgi:heme-degrading monooxygenase HmoA
MIMEVEFMDIQPDRRHEFEKAYLEAEAILTTAPGYLSHEIHESLETPGRYLLLVRWELLEDHVESFRSSPAYPRWRELLYPLLNEDSPNVEHFQRMDQLASDSMID